MKAQFILYVKDQNRSRDFYKSVLLLKPVLDVPGMTEFQLSESTKLGIMPEAGINKILQPYVPNPASGSGIPRCELYLYVEAPELYLQRALGNGAILISETAARDWGDKVAYCADKDGHVIAFATKLIR